ncbi:MAG: tetratricopeptide repeat protein [Candidatus Obscuribacterales bacterium]|nr:tetratricopeptide repeat protein [Candidatus Obscuribacterales bacterium]
MAQGQNNPQIPEIQIEVGNFYLARNQPQKAEDLYRKALDYRIKSVGKEHQQTARVYKYIGRVYINEGRTAEAVTNFKEALDIYKKKLERDRRIPNYNKKEINLEIAETLDDLARTFRYTDGAHVSDVHANLSGRMRANPQADYYDEL